MTLRPFCDCIYLERIDAKPDAGLLAYLLPDVIDRAESFLSPKRQSDFLWTRLLLIALAKVRGLAVQFRETRPTRRLFYPTAPFIPRFLTRQLLSERLLRAVQWRLI